MRRLVVLAAVCLVAASCGAEADVPNQADAADAGNAGLFCAVWPEARRALLAGYEAPVDEAAHDTVAQRDASVARYDRVVPTGVRQVWDIAHEVYADFADLWFTTGYSEDNVRTEHLVMLFGNGGAEPAISDALNAITAIEEWALIACGDFCSRWSELEHAVRFDPQAWHWLAEQDEDAERLLEVGSKLVPDEVAEHWAEAAAVQLGFLQMLRDLDFDMRFESVEEEDAVFTAYVGGAWDDAQQRSGRALDVVLGWVENNCDPADITAVGSGPGRLRVSMRPQPGLETATTLLALLPAGTDFRTVDSITDYVAGVCVEGGHMAYDGPLGDRYYEAHKRLTAGEEPAAVAADMGVGLREFLHQWGWWRVGISPDDVLEELQEGRTYVQIAEDHGFNAAAPFRMPDDWTFDFLPIRSDTEYDDDVCQLHHEENLILEPGPYVLYAGAYRGDPGDWRFFVSEPMACTQISIVIAGDTTIDMPDLGPCDLPAIGSEEEIARRNATVAMRDAALWVRLPDSVLEPGSWCDLQMVLLPSGTTLNELGRGNVWPSGGVAYHSPDEADLEEGVVAKPGLLPVLAYPPTQGLLRVGPRFQPDGTWDTFPAPAALDGGAYDLRVQQWCSDERDQHEEPPSTCAMVAVDVRGDTVIELPELGACP